MAQNSSKRIKEPSIVIKPIGRYGGLDGIHIALIILLALALIFLLYISYARQTLIIFENQTQSMTSCQYGYIGNTLSCITPVHNSSSIEHIFEQFLAGYVSTSGSQAILPFSANTSQIKTYYLSNSSSWLVTVPEKYTTSNITFLFSAVISDLNTSRITPYVQTISPTNSTSNFVAGYGYVKLSNKLSCSNSTNTPLYWFLDPYSPGSISSLSYLQNIMKKFNTTVSPNIEILYTQDSQAIANSYGIENATLLGKYLFCSSSQPEFGTFANTLNSSYKNMYMSPSVLQGIANNSGLNLTELSSCIFSAGTTMNRQAVLAKYYNITSSPSVLIGCQYLALPQTAYQTLCSIKNDNC